LGVLSPEFEGLYRGLFPIVERDVIPECACHTIGWGDFRGQALDNFGSTTILPVLNKGVHKSEIQVYRNDERRLLLPDAKRRFKVVPIGLVKERDVEHESVIRRHRIRNLVKADFLLQQTRQEQV